MFKWQPISDFMFQNTFFRGPRVARAAAHLHSTAAVTGLLYLQIPFLHFDIRAARGLERIIITATIAPPRFCLPNIAWPPRALRAARRRSCYHPNVKMGRNVRQASAPMLCSPFLSRAKEKGDNNGITWALTLLSGSY